MKKYFEMTSVLVLASLVSIESHALGYGGASKSEMRREIHRLERELKKDRKQARRVCRRERQDSYACETLQDEISMKESELEYLREDLQDLRDPALSGALHADSRGMSMNGAGGGSQWSWLSQIAQMLMMTYLGNQAIDQNAALGWPTSFGGGFWGGSGGLSTGFGGYAGLGSSTLYAPHSNYYLQSQGGIPIGGQGYSWNYSPSIYGAVR